MNQKLLADLDPEYVEVAIYRVGNSEISVGEAKKAEADEIPSLLGNKSNKRWLLHTIDHNFGQVLAEILGNRQSEVLLQQELLKPLGVQKFYTDKFPNSRHITEDHHQINKYKRQKIESQHLT